MLKYDNMWYVAGMQRLGADCRSLYGIQVSGQGASTSNLELAHQSSVDLLSGGLLVLKGSIFASIVLIGCIAFFTGHSKKKNRLPQALMLSK